MGQADTLLVSDLFYATNYNLTFQHHPHVTAEYDVKTKKLVLKPSKNFNGLTTLAFKHNNHLYTFPIFVKKRTAYTFKFKPNKPFKTLRVIGSFNTWNRRSALMQDADGDGVYTLTYWLHYGRYEYKFYMDETELADPQNNLKVKNPWGHYNSLLVLERPAADPFIAQEGMRKKADEYTLNYTLSGVDAKPLLKENFIVLQNNQAVANAHISLKDSTFSVTLPIGKKENDVLVRVAYAAGDFSTPITETLFINGKLAGSDKKQFNWKDAIAYSLMTDRFYDGDKANTKKVAHADIDDRANYYGGDLAGITQKLDYLKELGVNVIWISPVNQNPKHAYKEYPAPHRFYSGYHGYWPVSSTEVDGRMGSMEELKLFINKAHDNGMKVLLDYVSNHVHENHPLYKEKPSWFGKVDLPDGTKNLRRWDEYRLTTWFEPYLPSFDYQNSQDAIEAMTDNAIWWLKESGADGFRQDAVKHVPNKFWRTLTRKIKEEIEIPEQVKTFQIGETFGSYKMIGSYVNNGQLTSQFNFNLYETALYTFLNEKGDFRTLSNELRRSHQEYGMFHHMGNLMDNHDKPRFMALADGDMEADNKADIGWINPPKVDDVMTYKKAQLYMLYMMSIPGLPFIYYGNEIGLTGAIDPDNRRMMRFADALSSQEEKMLLFSKKVTRLRKENPALRYGDFHTVYVDEDIFAFTRADMQQRLLIVLNKNAGQRTVEIPVPAVYKVKNTLPLFGAKGYAFINNRLKTTLPAYSGAVFLLK